MVRNCWIVFFLFVMLTSVAQDLKRARWVDSVFTTMDREEKIGQLFLVNTSSYDANDQLQKLISLAKEGKISGVIFGHSGPNGYAKLINQLQNEANIPLLVAAGVLNGLSETFDSTTHFFDKTVLFAIANDSLRIRLDQEIIRQKKIFNIDFQFATHPDSMGSLKVVDVLKLTINPKLKKNTEDNPLLTVDNFLLIEPEHIDVAIKVISRKTKKDKVLANQLDQFVKKILFSKYDVGLTAKKLINTDNLFKRLHEPEERLLMEQLAEAAITVVKDKSAIVPIQKLDSLNFASISIGDDRHNTFTHYLSKYADIHHFSMKSENDTTGILAQLKSKEMIIVGLFPSSLPWIKNMAGMINALSLTHQVVVCDFGNSKQLSLFENVQVLIAGYSDGPSIQKATAEIIFGGMGARGKLPFAISDSLLAGTSIKTKSTGRFTYAVPEEAGMDSFILEKIEPIANEAIAIGATPGCHVLVARNGKIIYEKSFGWLTYEKKIPVTDQTIYDLASVTKVSATLQGVMYLQEKGLIDINKKASVYLPELKKSNKEDFIIKDIITHQAGLWPFLPFWAETVKDSSLFKKYYSHSTSAEYPFPVADNLFAAKFMKDSLWHWIIKAKVREKPYRSVFDYRYSDMGFYIMQHLNEKLLGQPQEEFLQSKIYKPLGATTTGYLPLRKFPADQIAPTEKDTLFRKSLLIGYVHDQGAAMHGGIAGHAGLFSDANDLAKLGQMWLNKGTYGGIQYFKPETIELFTAKQYENSRRGLGWDKSVINDPNGPTTMYASSKTFGHTGFTGTCIWIDPEFNLVYVFLSNRVNPDMNNTKLLSANIRPRIQEVIYQSIFDYCKKHPSFETK